MIRETRRRFTRLGEVLAAYRRLASQFGDQAQHVIENAQKREQRLWPELATTPAHTAHEAVSFSNSFEREPVTNERAIMRDALKRGMRELKLPEIRSNFEQQLARASSEAHR